MVWVAATSACLGLAAAPAVVFLGSAGATITTTTFAPTAGAHVAQNKANSNFGTDTKLKVAASPTTNAYLKFSVQGLSGTVRKATIRLNTASASTIGFDVRNVANTTWGETTITYANAPPPSTTITGSSGTFGSEQ